MIPAFLLPYLPAIIASLAACAIGFYAAWNVQDIRIQNLRLDHEHYVTEQYRARIESEHQASRQRDETAAAWAANLDALRAKYRAGWLPKLPAAAGDGLKLPAAPGAHETSPDPVPAARGAAAQVVTDCAETTLQLNALQADIQKQLN